MNIGRHIELEIHQCANTYGTIVGLGHHSLISHLCKRDVIDVSLSLFERLRQPIDISYINRYCIVRE